MEMGWTDEMGFQTARNYHLEHSTTKKELLGSAGSFTMKWKGESADTTP